MASPLTSVVKPLGILAAAVVVFAAIKSIAFLVGPLVLAILFVAVLRPLYGRMAKKIPVGAAAFLTVILFIVILLFVGWVFGLAISSTVSIAQEYAPAITENFNSLSDYLANLPAPFDNLAAMLQSVDITKISAFLTGLIGTLSAFLGNLVLVFLLFVFSLAGGPALLKNMKQKFGENHPLTRRTLTFLDSQARYFILRTLVNAVTAVGVTVVCLLLGIPDAWVWGLLTFVLSYIPYIGMFIACVPPGLIAFATGGVELLLVFILLCILINGLAEQVIAPIVTGRGLSISPVVIFISFIFWGWLLGSIGYIVAVPMTLLVLLFMSSFEETDGIARLFSDLPD
jgi:predicted PurR-regulated permease PerM